MGREIARIILIFSWVYLTIYHIYWWYYSYSCVFTALLFYSALFVLIDLIIGKLLKLKWKRSGGRITFWTIFVGVVMLELVLRYDMPTYKSYMELNGSFYYVSPYSQYRYINHVRLQHYKYPDAGLQVANPGFVHHENKIEFQYDHVFNTIGIRDKDYSAKDLDTAYVILGLGDSFTEGVGAPQDSSWVRLLEHRLKSNKPNLVAINGGAGGSDVFYEFHKLKELLYSKYQPDEVILAINSSDIQDWLFEGGMERFKVKGKITGRRGPWWEPIYAFSYISRLIVHQVFDIKYHYYTEHNYQQLKKEAETSICNCVINEYRTFASKNNIELTIVFWPIQTEIQDNYFPYKACEARLREYNDIKVINLYEDFAKLDSTTLQEYYWKLDRHNTSKGYKYGADMIYKHWLKN